MEVYDKKNNQVGNGKRHISVEKRFNKQKLWFWRLIAVACIIPGWIIMFAPFFPRIFTDSFPKANISQNEILLDKLDLSNITVLCPEGYTFSRMEQRCSTVCGYYDNYPLPLTIFKRVLLSAIAVINTGVTILAIYRLIRYRKQYKFQHHPIFVGVFVNLLLSIVIGVPDIIGAKVFFCGGKEIDYATLNANPTIQVHIHGALIIAVSLSNRLWFVMALVLIFLATFSMKNILEIRRNRIIIVSVEVVVCIIYPVVCSLTPFVPFNGYMLSHIVMLPVITDVVLRTIFSFGPQLLLSPLTLTIIILIVYRIHSQVQIGSSRTGKRASIQPIEKRLIFFSILYFALNVVISITLISIAVFSNIIDNGTNDYVSYLTLNSLYFSNISTTASHGLNKTLTMLSPNDQLLVEHKDRFFIIFIQDISIRSMFILVLSVLNFSCSKKKLCQKKNQEIKERSTVFSRGSVSANI